METLSLTLGDTALILQIDAHQHLLPTGIATLVKAFGQRMPTALTLENAIADVEDAVMPAAQWLPAGAAALQTVDPLLVQVIHSATGDPQAVQASREAIENLFEALAHQAQRPGHTDSQLPQTPEFAAALLILREALHHWGLHSLQASHN